jgi:hypothetical protein
MDDETKTQSDATNATRKYMPDLNAVRRTLNEAQSFGLVNGREGEMPVLPAKRRETRTFECGEAAR